MESVGKEAECALEMAEDARGEGIDAVPGEGGGGVSAACER
jgi:hypothetical protein